MSGWTFWCRCRENGPKIFTSTLWNVLNLCFGSHEGEILKKTSWTNTAEHLMSTEHRGLHYRVRLTDSRWRLWRFSLGSDVRSTVCYLWSNSSSLILFFSDHRWQNSYTTQYPPTDREERRGNYDSSRSTSINCSDSSHAKQDSLHASLSDCHLAYLLNQSELGERISENLTSLMIHHLTSVQDYFWSNVWVRNPPLRLPCWSDNIMNLSQSVLFNGKWPENK